MKMRIWNAGLVLAIGSALALGQASPAAFEVAVIRQAPPPAQLVQQMQSGKANLGFKVDGSRVSIGFVSFADLVYRAYGVKPYQVEGPSWMPQERFDIQAKIPEGVLSDRIPEMLRSLLADRFKMTIHREKKDQPIYALIVGKNGPKLVEATAAPDKTPADSTQFKVKPNGPNGMVVEMGNMRMSAGPDGNRMEIGRIGMLALAEMLSNYVDRPVIDMTGLTGEYQLALDLSPEDMRAFQQRTQQQMAQLGLQLPMAQPAGANSSEASAPGASSVFGAVEKLGLKLEARKAPMEVIVIDQVEKTPTEN